MLHSKYENMGQGMRLFEAVINKSEQNSLKMAFYGAYYSIFKDELKQETLQNKSNPQDKVLLEAWNYPNVSKCSHRKALWSNFLWRQQLLR